jgi:hypothetical protein
MWPLRHGRLVKSGADMRQNGTKPIWRLHSQAVSRHFGHDNSRRIARDFSGLSSGRQQGYRVIHSPVPFVQHRPGIQQLCLWEAAFAIACMFPLAKVSRRRRGLPQVVPSGLPAWVVWVVAGRLRGPSKGAQLLSPKTGPSH